MFAINVPLRRCEDVETLVNAGADTFYCGLNDAAGTSGGGGLNQRQSDRSSFESVADLKIAVEASHSNGKEIFLAINTRLLTEPYQPGFIRQLQIASDLGIDSVIVGSINGILIAREMFPDMRLTASIGLGVMNSAAARWAAGLGVYRVIVDRHLTPDEIAMVADGAPDVEIEAFLMNGKCGNFDAMCGYDYYDPAGPMANFTGCVFVKDRNITRYRRFACGACALPAFATRPNFAAAKIIGRDFDVESVSLATDLVRRLRPAVYSDISGVEFNRLARATYREVYGKDCEDNCHYPTTKGSCVSGCGEGDCSSCGDAGACGSCGSETGCMDEY